MEPTKAEVAQIFKRLRSNQANKICFDCGAKNPTWSSVTYGVFICIDCSGIHRSLGVHLTFVRSTQLDSSWTWQQLRQMQLGGNANATLFFRKHNCDSTDAQLKYKSRAAQLYRDKLHSEAAKAIRVHGTKLFIESQSSCENDEESKKRDEENDDFFDSHEAKFAQNNEANHATSSALSRPKPVSDTLANSNGDGGAPNVDAALSTSPTSAAAVSTRKPTIGQRKPQNKKSGLGAKKTGGLGARKVVKDFAEIERAAELADESRERAAKEEVLTAEEEEKAVTSMRLAYQDLSVQQKQTEKEMRSVDPKKANQVERLGMGATNKGGVSHSAISEIAVIDQEEPSGLSKARNARSNNFEDDFEFVGRPGFSSKNKFARDDWEDDLEAMSSNSMWERELETMKATSKAKEENNWSNVFDQPPNRGTDRPRQIVDNPAPSTTNFQQKYASAKAISSDMIFGQDQNNSGPDANISRFQGSKSISSDDYFGREAPASRGMSAPDLDDVKESVRQGVSKVAGRLSNMASGAINQLQDKYGY